MIQEQKRPSERQADLNESMRLMLGQGAVNEYGVDQAAVRPETPSPKMGESAQQRALQQMGISAADRVNRQEAGLPPRVHDLT